MRARGSFSRWGSNQVSVYLYAYAQALARLREEVGVEFPGREITVEFMPLDLSSFQSTQQFITAFKERNLPLHILINNAGVALVPQGIF